VSALLVALQFLTRLPVPSGIALDDTTVGRSLLYYPLVGLIIGALLLAVAWLFDHAHIQLQAALLVACWVLITGGLHLDGLADSADAWAGGLGNRERTLAIMKDPSCGPAGVVSLVLLLLIIYAALLPLLENGEWHALILVPLFARMLPAMLLLTAPYARTQGLGRAFADHAQRRPLIYCYLLVLLLAVIVSGGTGLLLAVTTIVVFLLVRVLSMARIGGVTGDIVGAAIVVAEASMLVVLALCTEHK